MWYYAYLTGEVGGSIDALETSEYSAVSGAAWFWSRN